MDIRPYVFGGAGFIAGLIVGRSLPRGHCAHGSHATEGETTQDTAAPLPFPSTDAPFSAGMPAEEMAAEWEQAILPTDS